MCRTLIRGAVEAHLIIESPVSRLLQAAALDKLIQYRSEQETPPVLAGVEHHPQTSLLQQRSQVRLLPKLPRQPVSNALIASTKARQTSRQPPLGVDRSIPLAEWLY